MKHLKIPQVIKEGSKLDLFLTNQLSTSMFTYREIFGMLGPLILDQFFMFFMGVLTTAMISSSGQDSISAVSLVGPISSLIMSFFSAISAGGTVVVAQYKGRGDEDKMRRAGGQVVLATFLTAIISAAALIIFAGPLIRLLFGDAEMSVQIKAQQYLVGLSISFVTFSLYQGAFSVMRGVGDTRTCLRLTVIINFLYFLASFLFLNILHLDIIGTAISYNLARAVGGFTAIYLLMSHKGTISIRLREMVHIDIGILKSIFKLGIPFAIEQIFFNGGSIIVQTYMVQLGTVSIAANAICNSLFSLFYAAALGASTLAITVVGQCIGARNVDLARKYGKKMIWLGTAMILASIVIVLPLMPFFLSWYHPEPETLQVVWQIMLIGIAFLPFFWSFSNIMPNTLRAAGDATFTTVVSLLSLWIIRVGLGYLIAIPLGFGINGVWVCMGVEWALRALVFLLRFRGTKWYQKKTIED